MNDVPELSGLPPAPPLPDDPAWGLRCPTCGTHVDCTPADLPLRLETQSVQTYPAKPNRGEPQC